MTDDSSDPCRPMPLLFGSTRPTSDFYIVVSWPRLKSNFDVVDLKVTARAGRNGNLPGSRSLEDDGQPDSHFDLGGAGVLAAQCADQREFPIGIRVTWLECQVDGCFA